MVNETGDVKKGTGTVGVQRQYTGTAGSIENAQVAVYLVYAGRRGHAAVDRKLYVPRCWTSDPDRCGAAGLGGKTPFATKPELAARMVTRFLDAGHQAASVAGDEVYGGNPKLRDALEKRGTGYILAVACSHEVTTGTGKFRARHRRPTQPHPRRMRHSVDGQSRCRRSFPEQLLAGDLEAADTDGDGARAPFRSEAGGLPSRSGTAFSAT